MRGVGLFTAMLWGWQKVEWKLSEKGDAEGVYQDLWVTDE